MGDFKFDDLFKWTVVRYVLASSTERVHCFVSSGDDAGEVVWESDEIYPATEPVVARRGTDDQVYVLGGNGKLYELDLTDGHVLQHWTLTLDGDLTSFLGSSDGLLAFQTRSSLYGFSLDTEQAWQRDIGCNQAAMGSGGRVYCADMSGTLHAVTSGGADAWTYGGDWLSTSPGAGTVIYRNPVISGQFVYGNVERGVVRLTTGGMFTSKTVEPEDYWQVGGFDVGFTTSPSEIIFMGAYEYNQITQVMRGKLYALGIGGNTVWESPPVESGTNWLYTDPVAADRLFVASFGGDAKYRLYAFDLASGIKIWESDTSMGTHFNWLSDIELETDDGPNVFIASQNGYLYAFSRADGSLAWKAELPASGDIEFIPRKPTTWYSASHSHLPDVPVSIDPLALILPGWLYAALHKPYPPLAGPALARQIQTLTRSLPAEARERIRARARVVGAYADLIEKALAAEEEPPG